MDINICPQEQSECVRNVDKTLFQWKELLKKNNYFYIYQYLIDWKDMRFGDKKSSQPFHLIGM